MLYVKTRAITMPTTAEIWLVKLPFSIYLGWVSVATIVNAAVYLYKIGWDGFGISETAWTIIMLIVGMILAVLVSFRYRDSVYPLVFTWAYIAIALKQRMSPLSIIQGLSSRLFWRFTLCGSSLHAIKTVIEYPVLSV